MDLRSVLEARARRFESCGFSGRFCEGFLLGARSFESCVVCYKSFEVIRVSALDFVRVCEHLLTLRVL